MGILHFNAGISAQLSVRLHSVARQDSELLLIAALRQLVSSYRVEKRRKLGIADRTDFHKSNTHDPLKRTFIQNAVWCARTGFEPARRLIRLNTNVQQAIQRIGPLSIAMPRLPFPPTGTINSVHCFKELGAVSHITTQKVNRAKYSDSPLFFISLLLVKSNRPSSEDTAKQIEVTACK